MPDFGIDDEARKKQRENLAKRSSAGLEKKYQDQNREALETIDATYAPPLVTVPQCHVCNSPHRLFIERQIIKGISYSAIARSLPPEKLPEGGERTVDRRSISDHYKKGHMPLDAAIVRGVLEEEADLLGQNFDEGVKGAITTRGMFNVMMRKAFDDAMNGVTTIEPRDFIQMAKVYSDMVSNEGVIATEEAKLVVRIFLEALTNVLDEHLEIDMADLLKQEMTEEIKRLRERDAIDIEVESRLRTIPRSV